MILVYLTTQVHVKDISCPYQVMAFKKLHIMPDPLTHTEQGTTLKASYTSSCMKTFYTDYHQVISFLILWLAPTHGGCCYA